MPRNRKIFLAVLGAVSALLGGYFLYMSEQGNFHAVTPGEAYRSAQLDRDELEHYIRKHRIKSVLNLRNDTADSAAYREEREVAAENDLAYFQAPISAKREPQPHSVENILKVFDTAPRPLLIHCRYGADRTGLASAMWKAYVNGESKTAARGQLSLRYFHLPFGGAAAMDRFFEKWEPPERPAARQTESSPRSK